MVCLRQRAHGAPVNSSLLPAFCIAQYAVQFIKYLFQTRRQLLPRAPVSTTPRSAIQQSDAGLPLQFYAMTDRTVVQSQSPPD